MARQNDEIVRHWVDSLVQLGEVRRLAGGTVRVDADGVILYHRTPSIRRIAWGPVELGRYVPRSKTFVLNGDGFTDSSATRWQTFLRGVATQRTRSTAHRVAVIPYAALSAARVEIDSIIPLEIVADEMEEIFHEASPPPVPMEGHYAPTQPGQSTRSKEIVFKKKRFRFNQVAVWGYIDEKGEVTQRWVAGARSARVSWQNATVPWSVQGTSDGRIDWQRLIQFDLPVLREMKRRRDQFNQRVADTGQGMFTAGEIPTAPGWYWIEQVHHLGACVFSGVGEDGRRHKFLSAFDTDEPSQMYFLAQLPDRSGAKSYVEALDALAPEFVHAARRQGRNVFRQGDVFAVETTLSDQEVYSFARTRTRREVALYQQDGQRLARVIIGSESEPVVREGEVREKIECACRCGHKRWIGWGPKARAALSIYNTGHTASEVVVSKKGTTYVRGTLYHDPQAYEPGRRREHQNVVLTPGKWHVAVRNTVPRRRPRPVAADQVPSTAREEVATNA